MLQQKKYVTPIYNFNIFDYHNCEIPADLQNKLNLVVKILENLDISLNFAGYYNGLIFYCVKEIDTFTPEKRQITESLLKLTRLSGKKIKFVEIIK